MTEIHSTTQTTAGYLQVAQQDICRLFERLLRTPGEASKLPMAQALRNLAGCKECRQCIADQGAVQILMSLSECTDEETQKACSDAMSFLSEFTNLQEGAVDVLLKTAPAQHLHSASKPSCCSYCLLCWSVLTTFWCCFRRTFGCAGDPSGQFLQQD
jgi:hypothetical protein